MLAYLSIMPLLEAEKITRFFSFNALSKIEIKRSLFPRSGSMGSISRKVSVSEPNCRKSLALGSSFLSESQSIYVLPDSIGALPPTAALDQAASRNSSLVASRSATLPITRSRSMKIGSNPSGMDWLINCKSLMSNGIKDSIPSGINPLEILLRSSLSNSVASSFAFCFISLFINNSRQGRTLIEVAILSLVR